MEGGGTSRRQETAPTSSERRETCGSVWPTIKTLEDPGGWSQSSSSLRPSFVSGIILGGWKRHRERSSDPREGHNQAKAVLRARPPLPRLPIATPTHPPSRCNVFCRRVDDPEPHRSATRNTTGDHLFAECVDRHAIIPTIYLRGGGRQNTRSCSMDPRPWIRAFFHGGERIWNDWQRSCTAFFRGRTWRSNEGSIILISMIWKMSWDFWILRNGREITIG